MAHIDKSVNIGKKTGNYRNLSSATSLKPANTNEHRILPLPSSINIGEPVLNELDNDSIRTLSMTNDV